MKADTFNTYTWDSDRNPVSVNVINIVYDAFDRSVEQQNAGTNTEILYSPIGKLALMSGQKTSNIFLPLPGGHQATYTGSTIRFRHYDWLGTARAESNMAEPLYADVAYAPFGETYSPTSPAPYLSFTGENSDTVAGTYDFLFRKYNAVQGRWISPDPSGLGAVDPTNPQSWNRYAYVLNNPLSYTDPLGLECVWDDGSYDSNDDPDTGSPGSCGSAGGNWVDHSYFQQNNLADWSGDPNSDIANYAQNFTTTVTATACPATPTQHGVGIGVQAGGTATAGGYVVGGVVNASAGGGVFYNPKTGPSLGGYLSGVLAGNWGGTSKGLPQQSLQSPRIVGAYAGYGPGVFLTNAGSAQQLSGPFAVLNVDLGIGIGKASVQFSADKNGTWIVTVNGGPAPISDGLGFDVSGFTTNTAAGGTGCP